MTEMIPITNVTNGTVVDDSESFAGSLYAHRYIIITASASVFLIIAGFSVLVMIVICICQRRRQALQRNLERQYETVDEPIYEMILNNNCSKTEEWSDFNTNCNDSTRSLPENPLYFVTRI